jgi:hypothetical protein
MSATHYQNTVDCPSCAGDVEVKNSRFVALPKKPESRAA